MTQKTGHQIVDAIALINITGDVTPRAWYKHVCHKTENGQQKVDLLAIDILSDIVYWYRPRLIRDEISGDVVGWEKKFSGDLLRRNPDEFAKSFNVSPQKIRRSMKTLERLDLIKIHLQPYTFGQFTAPNVMFISINPKRIEQITDINYKPSQTCNDEKSHVIKFDNLDLSNSSSCQICDHEVINPDNLDSSNPTTHLYIEITKENTKERRTHKDTFFSSNPEQANSETNEPDPAPTIPSLVVQKLNSETELEIQTDSEAQGKLIADVEEKETPLPPFADAFPSETSEENKTECGNDPRFDKKIPFSGDLTSSSYRSDLSLFYPKLPETIAKGARNELTKRLEAKMLLCYLNEEGIDAIAQVANFLDYYFKEHLRDTATYKDHRHSPETLQSKITQAIANKIQRGETGVLIQAIADFKKKLNSQNKPSATRNKAFDDLPERPVQFKKPAAIALLEAKRQTQLSNRQNSINNDPNLSTKVG